MKYAFLGTPEFAAQILERLVGAGFPPAALITNPDRPKGRKKTVTPPPAKQSILDQEESIREQIRVFQPEKIRDIEEALRAEQFDLFIVAAYGGIIPQSVLSLPRFGTLGIHPSLLPRHRGPTPIQTAILEGDTETGVTLFAIDAKVDHGPIIDEEALEPYPYDSISYTELHDALARLGADMTVRFLSSFDPARMQGTVQDETKATHTRKFAGIDAYVDEAYLRDATQGENPEKAIRIDRMMRALNPEPGVYTVQDGKRIKLLEGRVKDGALRLTLIQKEGKKPESLDT